AKNPVAPAAAQKRTLALKRVVLDPGHGGKDPGAVGRGGLKEKHIVLDLAKMVKRELESRGGYEVILTRTTDKYLDLEERSVLANKRKADMFVSIHVNASRNKNLRGIETYVLDTTTEKSSQEVAERENMITERRMHKSRDDVSFMLASLALQDKSDKSARLADKIHYSVVKTAQKRYKYVKDNHVRGAMFYVLYGAKMPSALFEASYITNASDAKLLKTRAYRKNLAKGVADGIETYFREASRNQQIARK
ncbi:N-acetylmuramoyl-L-alanine amidase, partial [Nitrospirota bacterium]